MQQAEKGETPLYRGREWNKQERAKKKKMKKASWFRPYDVVLFVPTTTNMRRENMENMEREGVRKD